MTKYVWIKWRTRHSAGYGSWNYREVHYDDPKFTKDHLLAVLNELQDEHTTDSEHWRGVEGDVVKSPPRKWLEDRARRLEDKIAFATEQLERVRAQTSKTDWRFALGMTIRFGMSAYVADPKKAEKYEVSRGYVFEVERAKTFATKEEAEKACGPDQRVEQV